MIDLGTESLALVVSALLQDPDAGGMPAAQPVNVARGFRFLIGAYTIIWVILAAYLFTLSVRIRRLVQQVRRLKERLGS